MLFSDTESFVTKLGEEEEESEYDELGFSIKRAINRIERDKTPKK